MTEERLAELESAAANALASYHHDCALYVRASELAELCRAARYGHDNGTWVRLRRASEPDSVPAADFMALGDGGGDV